MARPYIIPIFISHQGCPHRCLFCDQQRITAACRPVTGRQVAAMIAAGLDRPRRPGYDSVQVAFYGGSFTGLPLARQRELLGAVEPFLGRQVATIRLSTRPDAVDRQQALFLRQRGVGLVELGVQSLDDRVLSRSRRGHTAAQVRAAVATLRRAGLAVGLQLMPGLPGETRRMALATASAAASLRPDCVRIYPALVLQGTGLARLFQENRFQPLTLQAAVTLAARMKEIFAAKGIPVIRVGLQPSKTLAESVLAGPYHPALGELVAARVLCRKIRKKLFRSRRQRPLRLLLAPSDRSLLHRDGRQGLRRLEQLGLLAGVRLVFQEGLRPGEVRLR